MTKKCLFCNKNLTRFEQGDPRHPNFARGLHCSSASNHHGKSHWIWLNNQDEIDFINIRGENYQLSVNFSVAKTTLYKNACPDSLFSKISVFDGILEISSEEEFNSKIKMLLVWT